MNPELKAWIDAICNSGTRAEQPRSRGFHEHTQNAARNRTRLFAFFADVVDEMDPKGCELRRIRRGNGDIGESWTQKDAIGHHGLI
jgi:hypothetical protein